MKKRAENGTRTRDPNLGKVVLYQLSYFRNKKLQDCDGEEEETRTPTSQLTLPPQSSASTNSATSPTFQSSQQKKECPEQDSNLHASRHTHLKRARLPIPPPGHLINANPISLDVALFSACGAENGTRTRDPNLGKVVLYQLSYFRSNLPPQRSISLDCGCKGNTIFRTYKTFRHFFSKKV